ncbi:hypothetical protein CDD83_5688 [Cordyceps sp. RAO-2017]|nr:hypothetical protein CDD83_5688 [Cordyceps sp. RAO-2017]
MALSSAEAPANGSAAVDEIVSLLPRQDAGNGGPSENDNHGKLEVLEGILKELTELIQNAQRAGGGQEKQT